MSKVDHTTVFFLLGSNQIEILPPPHPLRRSVVTGSESPWSSFIVLTSVAILYIKLWTIRIPCFLWYVFKETDF
jgi:hypothetical protein